MTSACKIKNLSNLWSVGVITMKEDGTGVSLLGLKAEEDNHEISKVSSLEKLGKEKELNFPPCKSSEGKAAYMNLNCRY